MGAGNKSPDFICLELMKLILHSFYPQVISKSFLHIFRFNQRDKARGTYRVTDFRKSEHFLVVLAGVSSQCSPSWISNYLRTGMIFADYGWWILTSVILGRILMSRWSTSGWSILGFRLILIVGIILLIFFGSGVLRC